MKDQVLEHFKNSDPIIFPHIEKHIDSFEIENTDSDKYFFQLTRKIAFQQLTGKAAQTIFDRVVDLLDEYSPRNILELKHEDMRSAGLSNSKINYIKNIAQASLDGELTFDKYESMSNQEIIEQLTKIKGVGKWTAEMFLMFTLGRNDIFSHGDLALTKGIIQIYGFKSKPKASTIDKIVNKWSPFKSYGSRTLWRVLDTKL